MSEDAALKRMARLGLIALTVRSVMQNLVILVANVYLARVLSPADYGVFGILQFALQLFRLVGDTGLGAALVQQREAPDDRDLSSIFWLQLGLGLMLVLVSVAAVPFVPLIWPTLTPAMAWLLPGLTLSLFFTMLRAVPFLMLERHVNFGWVGMLEFLGTLVFYGTAVVLAGMEAGAASLVWATVGQSALISIVANVVQPWRPKLIYDHARVRKLLSFGFAFQGNNVVGFINAAATPLLVGARLGKEAMGIVQFAQSTAWFPTLPVGIVRRVYFPFLSRLQHDPPAFAREFEKAALLCALPSWFFAGLFFGGAPAIVNILYTSKWDPAVVPIYFYSLGFAFAFYTWIGTAAVEAMGHTSRIFWVSLASTVSNWIATVVATWIVPTPTGFAAGYFVHLVVSPIAVYFILKPLVPSIRPIAQSFTLAVAASCVAVLGRLALPWVGGPISLTFWALGAIIVYVGAAIALHSGARAIAVDWLQQRGWLHA